MLVEDDPDVHRLTRLSLEVAGGYEVRVCGSGAEALRSARAYAPDLILLDVMMSCMDGLATLDALRKVPAVAETPMVFFTADTRDELRQHLLHRGALGVVVNPFQPNALVQQIRAIWQRLTAGPSP